MATLYSNELKAVVVQDNFLENPLNVMKENCQTVQHFDYRCEHRRNEAGDLYGVSEPVLLNFSVSIGSPRDGRPYYRAMAANEHYRFSFIFNATFNSMGRLNGYEDGMVVDGYVVHIEEQSAEKDNGEGEDRQTLLKVMLQVCSVTYLGSDNNYKCTFIQ